MQPEENETKNHVHVQFECVNIANFICSLFFTLAFSFLFLFFILRPQAARDLVFLGEKHQNSTSSEHL